MDKLQERLVREQSENALLISRSTMLMKTLKLCKDELQQLRARRVLHTDTEEQMLSREFAGNLMAHSPVLTYCENSAGTLTPQQIVGMTEKDLAWTWSQQVKELAGLLLALEEPDAPAEVLLRIQVHVHHELLFLYIRAALTNVTSVKKFVATTVDDSVRVVLDGEGPAMWRRVAAALQLTDAQRADILWLWQAFRENLMGLVTAREKIHAKISATMPIGTMARDFALQFLAAEEAMDELKHNLRSELVLVHEFLSTLYTQKLTVLQMARCIMRSFPYFPDLPAIVLWVAASENDACAMSVLQQAMAGWSSGH